MIARALKEEHATGLDLRPPDAALPPHSLCVCTCHSYVDRPVPALPLYRTPAHQRPLVSVLCPTSPDRHWAHPNLYRCFAHQTWPDVELVVLDTGDRPSPFFSTLDDPRVRYTHVPLQPSLGETLVGLKRFVASGSVPPAGCKDDGSWAQAWALAVEALDEVTEGKQWFELEDLDASSRTYANVVRRVVTLGAKRNWLASQAKGTVLANFDDDDLYLESYVDRMVSALVLHGADLVKLGSFAHLEQPTQSLFLCDPSEACKHLGGRAIIGDTDASAHGLRWGYGFSYVYTREAAARAPLDALNFGEDYKMVTRAAAAGKRCLCFASVPGDALALHVTHTGNASSVVPGRLLASLPGSDRGGDGRADDAFDSCFAHPCTHLLRAVAADFAEGKREEAREMVARRKEHRAALKALKVAPAAEPRPEWHQKLVDEERDERRAERMMVAASRRQQSFAFGEREESSVARAQMLADYAAVAAAQAE